MIGAFTQDRNQLVAFGAAAATARDEQGCSALPLEELAEVARVSLVGADAANAGALRRSAVRAEALAALAVRSRMTGACARAHARAGIAMPPPLARAVDAARARAAISNGRVLALARIAFAVLERAGIAALAFKGPFQHRLIHGDAFFCRSGDLDLLVARENFGDALAAFEAEGFVRREGTSAWWTQALGEVHLVHPQGGVIDLHHRLQQPGCPPPRDLGAFLRGSAREVLGGVEIAVPTRAQAVLICALNFTKEFAHRRLSARYAYDVAAGLIALEPEEHAEFAALVACQHLAGTAGLAVALAERIFDLDLPLPTPLERPALPGWAERGGLLAMAFDPEAPATPWPRRRAILWALCSGAGAGARAAEFSREAARILAGEALRRAAPDACATAPVPERG